ncbi:MAG: dihydroorotase [Phycisphaerales bacterium]|nr:dihydroorotase [Phycisphaerales bacterium]MCB9862461.1 dihydroorotase [Phycisphaerales bacterium]
MARAELLIKGGRVIDPAQGIDQVADVAIADGRIVAVGANGGEASGVIDATGQIVCPGLIDMHVHLREPGQEDEETIASGAAAAVAGGFTSVACMPNTDPAIDTEAMVEFVYRQAKRAGLCNVYPIGAITKGRKGAELAEIGQMVRAGAVAFSDDGAGIANSSVMFRAMQYVKMFGTLVIQHCEDADLAGSGCMNAGVMAMRLGLPGIPAMAEEVMIQRDVLISKHTGTRYHVAHISTAGAVQLVRDAKAQGVRVTTEVCPHHLLMTDAEVATYDTNYKMNPPLRSQADVDACLDGVADDTIDCLVTDHAPHGMDEKADDFQTAPFGIVGLEVALPLFAKALVESGRLTFSRLIEKLTVRPAEILGIEKGTLKPGVDADVTVFDPDAAWTVDISKFRSKSRNCPYDGWRLKGLVTNTIVGGSVKFSLDPALSK